VALFEAAPCLRCAEIPARPNIIFIMSDDHAAHALGCYGSKINQTPNLDRLAASPTGSPDGRANFRLLTKRLLAAILELRGLARYTQGVACPTASGSLSPAALSIKSTTN
jgi:hypothetical protein